MESLDEIRPAVAIYLFWVSGQIGDKHCWKSDKKDVGNGCQEITALIPNQKQSTKMAFEGQGEATSDIVLTQDGNATKKWFGR